MSCGHSSQQFLRGKVENDSALAAASLRSRSSSAREGGSPTKNVYRRKTKYIQIYVLTPSTGASSRPQPPPELANGHQDDPAVVQSVVKSILSQISNSNQPRFWGIYHIFQQPPIVYGGVHPIELGQSTYLFLIESPSIS